MTNPTNTGPNGDGSKSLAKESKAGRFVAAVLAILADAAIGGLTSVDTSTWSGWWAPLATTGLATAAGLLTAWRKKNR